MSTSIDIDAPVQEVWEVVMDPHRLADWVTIHRKLVSSSDEEMEQVLCLRGADHFAQHVGERYSKCA